MKTAVVVRFPSPAEREARRQEQIRADVLALWLFPFTFWDVFAVQVQTHVVLEFKRR
jgi:hypothetical protein